MSLTTPQNFAKAHLLIEGGARFECWFNPTTLQIARRASWQAPEAAGQGAPDLSYVGSREEWLTVNILLHADEEQASGDVRAAANALMALLNPTVSLPGRTQKRPPTLQFVWGAYVSFTAVCDSIDLTTELFSADGTPIRAVAVVKLRQFQPEVGQGEAPPTNPTTRASATRLSHTLGPGDSLLSVAYEHLGDAQRWREIAEFNGIDDPTRLRHGARLVIETGAI
jgi:nucleoid-associated protein YgaU